MPEHVALDVDLAPKIRLGSIWGWNESVLLTGFLQPEHGALIDQRDLVSGEDHRPSPQIEGIERRHAAAFPRMRYRRTP